MRHEPCVARRWRCEQGSGKTHTMVGVLDDAGCGPDAGIIPRVIESLFSEAERAADSGTSVAVRVSFAELYNEEVGDLLDDTPGKSITMRDNHDGKVVISGLREVPVASVQEARHWLQVRCPLDIATLGRELSL
jgi:hypothetical protein